MAVLGFRHAMTRRVRAASDESSLALRSSAQPPLPAPGGGAAARAPARPASSALAPQAPGPGPPRGRLRPPHPGRGPLARELCSSHAVPPALGLTVALLPERHAQQAPRGSPGPPGEKAVAMETRRVPAAVRRGRQSPRETRLGAAGSTDRCDARARSQPQPS